ncbi:MAG TPA: tetratricopeptide repeat protein, partial [Candidatus Omnitrophota bacterium]|nr:tetratricopeptide repeat protein [Candidatus Omnitrophota bacterium]
MNRIARWKKILFAAGLAVPALYFIFVCDDGFHGPDEPVYFAYTESIVNDGDLNIVNNLGDQARAFAVNGKIGVSKTGNLPDFHNHGGVLIWAPWYAMGKVFWYFFGGLLMVSEDVSIRVFLSISSVLCGLAAVLLSFLLCRRFFSLQASWLATAVIFLATPFWYYMTVEPGNANMPAALFGVMLLLYGIIALHDIPVRWLWYGLFFGVCIVVKLDLWFYLLFISSYFFARLRMKRTPLAAGGLFCIGMLLPLVLKAVNDYIKYGSWRMGEFALINSDHYYLIGQLFSAYRGSFYASPVFYICLAAALALGVGQMRKRKVFVPDNKDVILLLLSGMWLAKIVILGAAFGIGGGALNARLLLTEFPVFVLLYARLADTMKGRAFVILMILTAGCVIWNLVTVAEHMVGLDQWYIHIPPAALARIFSIRYLADRFSFFPSLGIKLSAVAVMAVSGTIAVFISRRFPKRKKDSNPFSAGLRPLALFFVCAYAVITASNVVTNRKNVYAMQAKGTDSRFNIVNAPYHETPENSRMVNEMIRYYRMSNDRSMVEKLRMQAEKVFNGSGARELFLTPVVPFLSSASFYCNHGFYAKAIRYYEHAIAAAPGYPDAYICAGNLYSTMGYPDKAVRMYEYALKIDPTSVDAHMNLAREFRHQGSFEAALDSYRAVLALRPDSVEALSYLASLYTDMRRYDDAVAVLRSMIALDPQAYGAFEQLAFISSAQGNSDEAIGYYKESLKINPSNTDTLVTLARLYAGKGRCADALELLQRAADLEPGNSYVHLMQADLYERVGDYGRAVRGYQRVLTLDPGNRDVLKNVCALYIRTGEADRALEYCRKGIEFDPGDLVRSRLHVNLPHRQVP